MIQWDLLISSSIQGLSSHLVILASLTFHVGSGRSEPVSSTTSSTQVFSHPTRHLKDDNDR